MVGTELVNTIVVIAVPVQIDCKAGVAKASGLGFTNTVAVISVPGQPFTLGVIVNVTVTADKVLLVNIPLIFPFPLAAIPATEPVLSLVHV